MYFVYIIQSKKNNSFYKGITNDPIRRLKEHNNREEKSTKRYAPWELVCLIEKSDKSQALSLEKKLKNLNRERTEMFIKKFGGPDEMKHLSGY